MAGNRGNLLPIYVMADESSSMRDFMGELNQGLSSLHDALLGEPMASARVRFSILGFSDDVQVRMDLADLRREAELPSLAVRTNTSYRAAFDDLVRRIPQDITRLKAENYQVHRPAVFFLSDGQPNQREDWDTPHRNLTDKIMFPAAPNIIACGIGNARAETILRVATSREFAFVSVPGADLGQAISKFCTALTHSIVMSGLSLVSGDAHLVVEKPEGFRMAIDVV